MKAHLRGDADSGLVPTVRGTAGCVSGVIEANALFRSEETEAFGDAGYQGRKNASTPSRMCAGALQCAQASVAHWTRARESNRMIDKVERPKAGIRAEEEHRFGHVLLRYRGLAKNTAQLHTLFAPANLRVVRRQLSGAQA